MEIAGGVYRELCCIPKWDAIFGSGGRAAAAVASLSPDSVLHTYFEKIPDTALINKFGISVQNSSRPTSIAFSYFHPLSTPHIEPKSSEIIKQPKIEVCGDVVLRFGFLEGDAVINARRAVYDPQTWQNPASFGSNGSSAKELAIVLNELELQYATGIDDTNLAALHLMEQQAVSIVIVKRGVKGAIVFERNGNVSIVPVYRTSKVFKIGTGDVFSAMFTYYWGEKEFSAADAADMASRSVATYCNTIQLPIKDDNLSLLQPIKFEKSGSILLHGVVDTIGQRYEMEEAKYILKEFGVGVFCPNLGDTVNGEETAVLVIAAEFNAELLDMIDRAKKDDLPVIILNETKEKTDHVSLDNIEVVDDFSSAIYLAAWAAAENANSM